MLTMVAVIGLLVFLGTLGVAIGMGLPGAERDAPVVQLQPERSRFFVLGAGAEEPAGEVSMEVLLARLEQHVRQERAAVETFPERPRSEDLRTKTSSPLAMN